MYLQYPALDIDESPLEWWKLECKRMPLLSAVARKYLCVCATSVPSERVFSVGGQLVSQKCNSLKPRRQMCAILSLNSSVISSYAMTPFTLSQPTIYIHARQLYELINNLVYRNIVIKYLTTTG